MKTKYKYLLSLLSAILLSLPWYDNFSGVFLWIAFVPLLFVEQSCQKLSHKAGFAFLTLFIWNAMTTWWIWNATPFGMLGAVIGNSLLTLLVVWLSMIVKSKLGNKIGYFFLVLLWITWEWFYFDAEITWPWLTIGNGFAKDIALIQWYEYTGVLGGTLWVWIINLLVFNIIKFYIAKQKGRNFKQAVITLALIIILPITYSIFRYYTYTEKINPCVVSILQPNIDPFNDKFGNLTSAEQLLILLKLADSSNLQNVDYVIAPETALTDMVSEQNLSNNSDINTIRSFLQPYPNLTFITGATTSKIYAPDEPKSYTARLSSQSNIYYDIYNAALWIDSGKNVPIYHKSKLVVGVEMLPYPQYLSFLRRWSIDLGGSSGGLGTQKERTVVQKNNFNIGTAICYESIFGQYYAEYVKNGANLMVIITNDGWWKDTPGHLQHLHYASLRAIETRRSIARSANTGISAMVDQRGKIIEQTRWWERDFIKGTLNTNDELTFYVQNGDVIGRASCTILALLILFQFAQYFRRKYPLSEKGKK